MYTAIVIFYVIISILILIFIMLQQGKGADAGALGGSGASQTVFGASGSSNFLSRTTAILVTIFFILCIIIASLNSNGLNSSNDEGDRFRNIQAPIEVQQPVLPIAPPTEPANPDSPNLPK